MIYYILFIIFIIIVGTILYYALTKGLVKLYSGGVEPTNCAYVIITEGKPEFHYLGDSKPDSVYNIGSVSKSLTSYLCAILHEKSLLDLNSTISKYDLQLSPKINDSITVKQLLNHTSGLSAPDSNINGFVSSPPTLREILDGVRMTEAGQHQFPLVDASRHNNIITQDDEPGAKWRYNGANYVVIQILLEKIFNDSLENIMRKYLLGPLGMNDTTMRLDTVSDKILTPHWKDGTEMRHYLFAEGAAAGIYSTIGDMAKFVSELTSPKLLVSTSREILFESPRNTNYGLGFMLLHDDILYHRGTNWGWKAYIYANGKSSKGFALLSNYQNDYQDWIDSNLLPIIR